MKRLFQAADRPSASSTHVFQNLQKHALPTSGLLKIRGGDGSSDPPPPKPPTEIIVTDTVTDP